MKICLALKSCTFYLFIYLFIYLFHGTSVRFSSPVPHSFVCSQLLARRKIERALRRVSKSVLRDWRDGVGVTEYDW